jgi:hypothetical protein
MTRNFHGSNPIVQQRLLLAKGLKFQQPIVPLPAHDRIAGKPGAAETLWLHNADKFHPAAGIAVFVTANDGELPFYACSLNTNFSID